MLQTLDGRDKVKIAIERLKSFEPEEGYFLAFSGGKDSQCIYHLAKMAGVKFDAHYSVTSVDPPELIRFIKEYYPDVQREIPHDKDGKPITMWNLIPRKLMPPTRLSRYCCEKMKECHGKERVTLTGVRWAESVRRRARQGVAVIQKRESIILNDDNDENRRMIEQCYRTHKTLVNPIVDWTDDDVWEFLNEVVKVPHCELYDQGYTRLGCIGCPMSYHAAEELDRYPKFKAAYIRSFEKMIAERNKRGIPTDWKTGEEVMDWWLNGGIKHGNVDNQIHMSEFLTEDRHG
jgi:phosphoadenosine phosphosulfate reductase